MKIPKDAKRIARRLFRSSFTDEVFDETRARTLLDTVVREKQRHYLAVLTVFGRLVRLEIARTTAQIESATELTNDLSTRIQQQLQRLYQRPLTTRYRINPALIGGVRITVGSDVWDGSVRNRLEMLKTGI